MGKKPRRNKLLIHWAAVFIIIGGLKMASVLVTPLLLALFFSIVSSQPIAYLQRKGWPKWVSITSVMILFLGLSFVLGGILGNSIARFTQNLPELNNNLDHSFKQMVSLASASGFSLKGVDLIAAMDPGKIMDFTASTLNELGNIVGHFFLIFLLAFFMLIEMDDYAVKYRVILGFNKKTKKLLNIHRIVRNIRAYLAIKTATSLITGLLIFTGLKIIGVDYAFVWALLAFLLNFIPNIGSFLAAIPVLLFVGVTSSGIDFFWTTLLYLTVNIAIGSFIEPRVMGQGMGLSTLIVIVSLVFWGWVLGPIGMFLSVPLTMTLKIILNSFPETQWLAILLGNERNAKTERENQIKYKVNKNPARPVN